MAYLQDAIVTSTTTLQAKLATKRVIVLDGSVVPLSLEEERALCAFVKDGGGLVCIGNAAEMYHEYQLLGEMLGPVLGF